MKARSWLSLQGQSNYVTSRINFNEVLLIFLPSSKIGEGGGRGAGAEQGAVLCSGCWRDWRKLGLVC